MIPVTPYDGLILSVAAGLALDADLLRAQVVHESAGHADAFRFEPGIAAQVEAGLLRPSVTIDAAIRNNPRRLCSSYGLLQLLYLTAVDDGFQQAPEYLFVPEIGLSAGARHLRSLLDWAGGNYEKALAAYNGGKGATRTVPYRTHAYVDAIWAVAGRSSAHGA